MPSTTSLRQRQLAARVVLVALVSSGLPAPLGAQTPPARGTRQPLSSLARLPSGVTLQYVTTGRDDGEPVVFLHGIGDSWHSWDLVIPRVPDRYRAVAVSMRGHGWSDKPEKGYSLPDFAADVTALLEQLDLKNVTLVGHSLGSLVAQVVAEQDKGRLSRLVLVGSGPGGPRDEKSRAELKQAFESIKDPMSETFARDFQASTAYLPVPADFFELMSRELARVPARVWHEFAAGSGDQDAVERLKGIRVPTLLVWGDRDSIFSRADQDVLVARIPNARLTVYADTGHALHWERPEKFATDLLAFLGGK